MGSCLSPLNRSCDFTRPHLAQSAALPLIKEPVLLSRLQVRRLLAALSHWGVVFVDWEKPPNLPLLRSCEMALGLRLLCRSTPWAVCVKNLPTPKLTLGGPICWFCQEPPG